MEALSAQPVDPHQRRLVGGGCVLRREDCLERPTDDHREEVGVRDVPDRRSPAKRAVAQDGDAIRDLTDLTQPVRDVDDGRPVSREPADEGEEELDGILRERCRRLVENQEPRRHGERLGEFEEVAVGDAEGRDAVLEMAVEVDVVEQRAHRFRHVRITTSEMLEWDGHADVLGDRHVRKERRMLMDDRDPELLRDRRGELVNRGAFEHDRAAIGRRRARCDVHQRRLAGAVFSEEGMHLAREHVERDVGERRDRVVVLGDAEHRQRRVHGGAAPRDRRVDGGFVGHDQRSRSLALCAAAGTAAHNACVLPTSSPAWSARRATTSRRGRCHPAGWTCTAPDSACR